MVKLITKKQPEIILKKEELLESRHWIIIHNIYKMKHYTIFYDYREHIFVNPGIEDYERFWRFCKVFLFADTSITSWKSCLLS